MPDRIELDVTKINPEKNIYPEPLQDCNIDVFLNGYLIKSSYMLQSEVEKFREKISEKGTSKIDEIEVVIRLTKGKQRKEIEVNGFLRLLHIGTWEDVPK